MLLSSADFFFKLTFSGTQPECQMVWIQIRTDVLSVLIWAKTHCVNCLQKLSADDKSRACKEIDNPYKLSITFHPYHFGYAGMVYYTPANFVCRGYTVFTLSVRPSVRPSVTLCFLNILKNHCWIFIKPCKHVHICKTDFLDKKVRARGQFYQSYFPL